MDNEKLIHNLIVSNIKHKLSKQYQNIKVNEQGSPDLILSNHGLTLAVVEVETENTITAEKAETWKSLAQPGAKLILMIPKHAKAKVTELLWEQGISDKVALGTYEMTINMP
jgi:hypothetical protein